MKLSTDAGRTNITPGGVGQLLAQMPWLTARRTNQGHTRWKPRGIAGERQRTMWKRKREAEMNLSLSNK
jgi:hypothetical protein